MDVLIDMVLYTDKLLVTWSGEEALESMLTPYILCNCQHVGLELDWLALHPRPIKIRQLLKQAQFCRGDDSGNGMAPGS